MNLPDSHRMVIMKPFLQKHYSLFSLAARRISNVLVRITVANTLQEPGHIQTTIEQAGNNTLLGGSTFKKDVEKELYKIQHTRWVLRKFALRWLFKRLHHCTTDDIVTLEPIKNPIHIVDWSRRHIYSFEVTTLHRDITQTLLHFTGMFPSPLRPKNPLTNMSLSLGQLVSVWNGFAHGHISISSPVANYRSMQFNHSRFLDEYSVPLSISSMKKCILNPLDIDSGDYLLDFIEAAYEYNNIELMHYDRLMINGAIHAHKNPPFLQELRRKCVDYNYILIVKKNNPAVDILGDLYAVYHSCLPIIKKYLQRGI